VKISAVIAAVEAKLKAAAQKVGAGLDVPEDKIEAILKDVIAKVKAGTFPSEDASEPTDIEGP
jgi:hypothetical protein